MARKLDNTVQLYMFISELAVVDSYENKPFIWDVNHTTDNLMNLLIERTSRNEVTNYGEFDKDGRVKYFVSILNKFPVAVVWLMHIKQSKRDISKPLLKEIFKELQNEAYTEIQFVSSNTQPSCMRWAKSLGGSPIAINYKIKL